MVRLFVKSFTNRERKKRPLLGVFHRNKEEAHPAQDSDHPEQGVSIEDGYTPDEQDSADNF